MFNAKVLADSTNLCGNRLITMEMTYPRFVHAEHLRHRMFSFNVASSRAIPVEKMIEQVEKNPVVPIHWGKAQKGMQAYEVLNEQDAGDAKYHWVLAGLEAVHRAKAMLSLGLHKQIINRLLEPWMWCTVICTGNQGAWNNFWALRCHPEAEPHMQKIAELSTEAANASETDRLFEGDWHLPLIGFDGDDQLSASDAVKVSAGRCARVSYLTHDGRRDVQADIDLCDRLVTSKHFSPTEHQARCWEGLTDSSASGNLGTGWVQFRKTLHGEYQND
jgi:thymidylate synthase ThyX